MDNNEKEIIESLQGLGLTLSEAKIFLYITKNPNSNGYEISKNTGISRSLVYTALERMRNTGFIELNQSNTSTYVIRDIGEIQTHIESNISKAFNSLEDRILSIKQDTNEELFITIPELENQISKLIHLVKSAKSYLYISAGSRELQWIKEELFRLPKGVEVHIFSFANIDEFSEFNTYSKNMEQSYIQSDTYLKNRWRILLIKDEEEMILCGGDDFESGVGISTKNRVMVQFAKEHFMHDVKIYNIERKYSIEDDTHLSFQR